MVVQTSMGSENVSLGTLHGLFPSEPTGACQSRKFVAEVQEFRRENPRAEFLTGNERLGMHFFTPPATGASEDLTLGDPVILHEKRVGAKSRKRRRK